MSDGKAGPVGSVNNPAEDMNGYYGQTDLSGHSASYDESTQTSKEVRHGAKQGVLRTQAEGPQGAQGERPAAQQVRTAVVDKEAAKKCADKQVGSNRQYINESVKRHQGEPE